MSEDFSGERIVAVYDASRRRILEIVRAASPLDLDRECPATPGWRVHDVISHLTGNVVDGLKGRITGPPPADITAEQVASRRGTPIAEVIDEWDSGIETLYEVGRAGLLPPPISLDIVSHEQDIRGALGLSRLEIGDPEQAEGIRFVAAALAVGASQRVKADGLPRLGIQAADTGWPHREWPEGTVVATASSEFEIARALGGRRSPAQVSRWEWSDDPSPYLDRLSPFGPLRSDDLVE